MQYKLYANSVSTTNAASSTRIVKKQKLKAIQFCLSAVAGAAVNFYGIVEISKQNTGSHLVNDAPPTILGYASISSNISGGSATTNACVLCDAELESGDTIYLNYLQSGTAPSSTILLAQLTCA